MLFKVYPRNLWLIIKRKNFILILQNGGKIVKFFQRLVSLKDEKMF